MTESGVHIFDSAEEVLPLSGGLLWQPGCICADRLSEEADNGPVKAHSRCLHGCVCVCERRREAVSNAVIPDWSVTRLQLWESVTLSLAMLMCVCVCRK